MAWFNFLYFEIRFLNIECRTSNIQFPTTLKQVRALQLFLKKGTRSNCALLPAPIVIGYWIFLVGYSKYSRMSNSECRMTKYRIPLPTLRKKTMNKPLKCFVIIVS